jgi:hypothetical protein
MAWKACLRVSIAYDGVQEYISPSSLKLQDVFHMKNLLDNL